MIEQRQAGLHEVPPREPTLWALLQGLSRRASDTQAALACALGTLVAAVILLTIPSWWRLSLASATIALFAADVVLERGASERRWGPIAQKGAVFLGIVCAFALALSLLTKALGTWIS